MRQQTFPIGKCKSSDLILEAFECPARFLSFTLRAAVEAARTAGQRGAP